MPEQLATLESAISEQNALQLQEAAHKLKGGIGNFTTQDAFESAKTLEFMGREHNMQDAQKVFARLKAQISQLQQELANIVQ